MKPPVPSKKISDALEETPRMELIVASLVCRDRIPMRTMITSIYIRRLMLVNMTKLPKSAGDVRNIIMNFAAEIKVLFKEQLKIALKDGGKLSLTMDEWTSRRVRKYMNVNIHAPNGRMWCLGLARVFGSADAEKCRLVMESLLADFGINFDQIVSVTTDGAAVMVKMGNLLSTHHQLCFAHAIHLTVCDVLYIKKKKKGKAVPVIEDQDDDDFDEDEESANWARHGISR